MVSLLVPGAVLVLLRLLTLLSGDRHDRLEYFLRGQRACPMVLALAAALSLIDAATLWGLAATTALPAGRLVPVLAGVAALGLLWLALDWAQWRQGWVEGLTERPEVFRRLFERSLWWGMAGGFALLLLAAALART